MADFSNHLDKLSSVVNGWPEWKRNIFGKYKEQNPMTQQFNTINDALKWCIDHPDQSCRDGQGREFWFSDLRFSTNMGSEGKILPYDEFALYPSDLHYFDLTTLCPVEPEKPTLGNLAALENWGWMEISYPGGPERLFRATYGNWKFQYSELRTALEAGWPVKFGRGEV